MSDIHNPWVLVHICDQVVKNGFETIGLSNFEEWGMKGTMGTYSGTFVSENGTVMSLNLGTDSGLENKISGFCAFLSRNDLPKNELRVDWRAWVDNPNESTPHIHLHGKKCILESSTAWQLIRPEVIRTLEIELGILWDPVAEDSEFDVSC